MRKDAPRPEVLLERGRTTVAATVEAIGNEVLIRRCQ